MMKSAREATVPERIRVVMAQKPIDPADARPATATRIMGCLESCHTLLEHVLWWRGFD